MQIGIPRETKAGETRVAGTPDSIKRLLKKGCQVVLETGAGAGATFDDAAYEKVGAQLVERPTALRADVVLTINPPTEDDISKMRQGGLLISLLEPYSPETCLTKLAASKIDAIAMERIPRTSRAQSMDALSSQANIAGYRAVLTAAEHYPRFFPMMMTSAGSAKAAKVCVLGVGVAGLQAIATAKRLGAIVEAYDIRPEVREQILSVGAKPIDLELGESGAGSGGYAKELSAEAKTKQMALLTERLKRYDIIITTANVPGRQAPTLITPEAVEGMRPGSLIVDLAAPSGGNCPLTKPNEVVTHNGVKILGPTNLPCEIPADSSNFYARNMCSLLDIIVNKDGEKTLNLDDDIIAAALAVHNGEIRS